MNLCEQAEAFRLLLLMGVVDPSEVIAWADRLIEEQDSVPDWLLDVSLAAKQDAWTIETKLRNLPGEWSRKAAAHTAMARFAEEFQIHDKFTSMEAAHMLKVWVGSAKVNEDDWQTAMEPSWIADEIAFGNATDKDVVASINACIEHFRAEDDAKKYFRF